MISEDPVERWEQLEDFLTGRMNKDEKKLLAEELKTNALLNKELESVRQAHQLLHDVFVEQQMRESIRKIRAEKRPRRVPWQVQINRQKAALYLAAAFIALVCYLTISPVVLPDAGIDVRALRQIDTFQLRPQQRIAFTNFFDGQARMLEGDYVRAAQHFENVLTVDDLRPYFKEAAQWHLAVSYLRSRQINRAHKLYQQLRECDACTYEVGWLERRKMEWQLWIASLIP